MSRVNLEDARLDNPLVARRMKYGVTGLADAAATISKDMGPVLYMTPGASRNVTLPAVTADMRGMVYIIITQAAFTLVVKENGGATIATVPANIGATGTFICLGDSTLGIGGWVGGL